MMKLPPFRLIRKPHDWQKCLRQLEQEPRIAIDLEANSMFAYRERVCLIQISTPTQDYIVDPLAPLDFTGLGALIQEPTIEKIFHASEYDLILLKRDYDWELNNLFDTMWAARILGYQRFGLASLLNDLYGVKLNKRHQKSNWCQRPLSNAQLAYAQHDTHFLFRLRDQLSKELLAADRMEEANETFTEQSRIVVPDTDFTPDSFWQINGVQGLTRRQQAILKALNIYRDQEARQRNQPLFKVLNDRTMVELAELTPKYTSELRDVYGMTHGQIRRYGPGLLKAIEEGKKSPLPAYPQRPKRQPEVVALRYERLHSWRKNRALARGVESDVIISRDALWSLARNNPQSIAEMGSLAVIGEWRRKTYGNEIIDVLNQT